MRDKERRILDQASGAEVRISSDGRFLEGLGIVFGKRSEPLGGFVEVIDPEVEIRTPGDLVATFNHDTGALLGRTSSGTLSTTRDATGFRYRVEIPDTTAGRDLRELVSRRDVRGSSFTFDVPDGGDTWERAKGGPALRTVSRLNLHELGPVVFPAYSDTTVALRSLEKLEEAPADYRPRLKLRRREQQLAELIGPIGGRAGSRNGGNGSS